MRRRGECHLKLKIFSIKTGVVFPASEEAEVAFAVTYLSMQASRSRERQPRYSLLWVEKPVCLCGSKVSISNSCYAPDSFISVMSTFARAAWVKSSSGYRCILRLVIFWRWSIDIKDFSQLVSFGVAKEEMLLMKHLCWDTTNTSHVHSYCICRLQKNFRSMGLGQPQGWGSPGNCRFWLGQSQPAWLPYYLPAECPLASGHGHWYSLCEANLGC